MPEMPEKIFFKSLKKIEIRIAYCVLLDLMKVTKKLILDLNIVSYKICFGQIQHL